MFEIPQPGLEEPGLEERLQGAILDPEAGQPKTNTVQVSRRCRLEGLTS